MIMLSARQRLLDSNFLKEAIQEWKCDTKMLKGRFISYLKARRMINKSFIYHLVRIHDKDAKPPTLQSIPVINGFLDVFQEELTGIPQEQEIYFDIDMLPGSQPISIPPYRMARVELKYQKDQLKDLLDKGFIRTSVSPLGASVIRK